MQTMLLPAGARRATSSAAASVAPLDGADEDAFLRRASSRDRRSASAPATGTISSISLLGHGGLGEARDEVRAPALHQVRAEVRMALLRAAVGVARLRDAAAEHRRVVGLGRDDADAGDRAAFSPRATPFSVPPVPKPVTK